MSDMERTETVDVVEDAQQELFDNSDVLDAEIKMAEEHGFIDKEEEPKEEEEKPEEESQEEPEEPKEEDKVKEAVEEELSEEDEFERIKDYSRNEKGLYFQMKKERDSRQEIEKEKELLAIRNEGLKREMELLKQMKQEPTKDDIDLDSKLGDVDTQINNIIMGGEEGSTDDLISRNDLIQLENLRSERAQLIKQREDTQNKTLQETSKKIEERNTRLEAEAKAKDPDYTRKIKLAQELVEQDASGFYAEMLNKAVNDIEGGDPIQVAYRIAELHPEFKTGETKKTGENETAKRMVSNSKKRVSSAALGTTEGTTKGNSDLSFSDVVNMPQDEYNKLPKQTRERILKELN